MCKNNNRLPILIFPALFSIVLMSLSSVAVANIQSSAGSAALIASACPADSEQYRELVELKSRIAAADTLNQARGLALAPTDEAIDALENARFIMPFSDDLRAAATRLHNARNRILVASSQEQVADAFDGMMLASLDNDRAARVSVGSGECDYSTGELIAIVIGLILGIIPGLILLVVLC